LGVGVFIVLLLAYLDSSFVFNHPPHILPLGPGTNGRT